MAANEERESLLGDLDAWAADAADDIDLADVGPSVKPLRRSSAAARQEEVPEELAAGPRVHGHGAD